MIRSIRHCLGAAILVLTALPAAAQETSLTIFQDGRVLVRRTFPVQVPAGRSSHTLAVEPLDPASVVSLSPGVRIEGMRYRPAGDDAAALRAALGKTIRFVSEKDTVSATVVSVDPPQYRMTDGSIVFSLPGRAEFPAELVTSRPRLDVDVAAARAVRGLGLSYLTRGTASWRAGYQVVLGPKNATVQGYAVIGSATFDLADVRVQLLAGNVADAYTPGSFEAASITTRGAAAEFGNAQSGLMALKAPSEASVGDAHIYSLPEAVDLQPGRGSVVALFEPATTTYERRYVLGGSLPWVGPVQQLGDDEEPPVTVQYLVPRKRGTELGDRPLPRGVVQLFRNDDAGRLQLIGAASIDHTPAGQPLELDAGTAFDLTAKRVQTEYRLERRGPASTTSYSDYRVTITNASDSAATVEVRERRRGDWEILSSSRPAERVSSTLVRFTVPVPAREEATLTYSIRAQW